MNALHVSHAVDYFIECRVDKLSRTNRYGQELQASIINDLKLKSNGTFLWVAMVCKELEEVAKRKVASVLQTFPPGLKPLYERMMERLENQDDKKDAELCKQTLCAVTSAFRPFKLKELVIFAHLPKELEDPEDLEDLINRCGAFLTVRQGTVYVVHQSVKDYFSTGAGSQDFPYEPSN